MDGLTQKKLIGLPKDKMDEKPDFVDEKLWITLIGKPEKKYYLGYNPHTHKGRMAVWDPGNQDVLYISKNDIENCSVEATYWIKGFISGNEPDPPRHVLEDDDPKLIRWKAAIRLFEKTGIWVQTKRKCTRCGKELLPSQPGFKCPDCLENG